MALTALFCLNCLHFSIQALRGRDREQQLLAACLLVFLGAAVHDLLLLFKRIDGLSYIPYTSIAVLMGMSAVQGLRHARSVRRIERFNEKLEISVQRAAMSWPSRWPANTSWRWPTAGCRTGWISRATCTTDWAARWSA